MFYSAAMAADVNKAKARMDDSAQQRVRSQIKAGAQVAGLVRHWAQGVAVLYILPTTPTGKEGYGAFDSCPVFPEQEERFAAWVARRFPEAVVRLEA